MPILIHCGPILLTLEGTLDNDDNLHNFSNEPTSLWLISLLFPQIMITLSQWKDYFCASLAPRLNPFPEFKYLIIVFFSLILLSTLGLIRMQYPLIKSEFFLVNFMSNLGPIFHHLYFPLLLLSTCGSLNEMASMDTFLNNLSPLWKLLESIWMCDLLKEVCHGH